MRIKIDVLDLTDDVSDDESVPDPSILLQQTLGQKRGRSHTPMQETTDIPIEKSTRPETVRCNLIVSLTSCSTNLE